MNTPFSVKRTTSVGRNGFDMSQRHLFNAFPGALIPVMVEECMPGEEHRIRLSSFTRMRNLQTAAFARFKEYYDFFFVPFDNLWPYHNSLVVNNNEPIAKPSDALGTDTVVPSIIPYVRTQDLQYLQATLSQMTDEMGVNSADGFQLLADMLGYGLWDSNTFEYKEQMRFNVYPFAAYQYIYQNYYRNSQWERRNPVAYNLKQYYGVSDNNIEFNQVETGDGRLAMFQLRYANWHKDYFMGLYPSQQFGDVSVVGVNYSVGSSLGTLSGSGSLSLRYRESADRLEGGLLNSSSSNLASYEIGTDVSIVDLRRAQALQRWKEVTMTNGSAMYQQVKAHFGFELPEGRKDAPEYLGGMSNVVTINDVDGTATTEQSYLGQVGGKGLGVSDPNKTIQFTSKDFGLLMCIYHVEPLLDYNAVGIKKFNTKLVAGDFYVPEFDRIGFGSVEGYELIYTPGQTESGSYTPDFSLGYSSRYLDQKTSYDRVHGSFMPGYGNVNDAAWVVALTGNYLKERLEQSGNAVNYLFFKVSPFVANNIMTVPLTVDNVLSTAPFMVSADFNYYKASNMSVDSLPY